MICLQEGNYHDYVELCKLYDKNENGTMMLAELENILSNLGIYNYFISSFNYNTIAIQYM